LQRESPFGTIGRIDTDLVEAGWKVQDRDEINLTPGRRIAIRESRWRRASASPTTCSSSTGKAVGALEAKKGHAPLIGIEGQAKKYLLPSIRQKRCGRRHQQYIDR
jgi:type I restriction enzyme, R subunit